MMQASIRRAQQVGHRHLGRPKFLSIGPSDKDLEVICKKEVLGRTFPGRQCEL